MDEEKKGGEARKEGENGAVSVHKTHAVGPTGLGAGDAVVMLVRKDGAARRDLDALGWRSAGTVLDGLEEFVHMMPPPDTSPDDIARVLRISSDTDSAQAQVIRLLQAIGDTPREALEQRTVEAERALSALVEAALDLRDDDSRQVTINPARLDVVIHDIRYNLLKKRVKVEVVDGKRYEYVPMPPKLLKLVGDSLQAALTLFSMEVDTLLCDPQDLIIFRASDDRHVSERALRLIHDTLRNRLERASRLDDNVETRVLVFGPEVSWETMSDADLKRFGLQRIPPVPLSELGPPGVDLSALAPPGGAPAASQVPRSRRAAERVVEALKALGGFDDWWESCDEVIQGQIVAQVAQALDEAE